MLPLITVIAAVYHYNGYKLRWSHDVINYWELKGDYIKYIHPQFGAWEAMVKF